MAKRSVSTIVCGIEQTLCISNDGNVYFFGGDYNISVQPKILPPSIIPTLKSIQAISTGRDHCACLDYYGNVFTFGMNEYGQLGIGLDDLEINAPHPVNLPSCTEVSCGYFFTICLTEVGEVYSFGDNDYGQLGLGNYWNG